MMEPDPPAFAQSPAQQQQQQQQQTYQEPANPIFQTNQQPPHPYQRQQQVPPQQAHPRQQTNMFQQHPQQSQSQNQQPPPPAPPAPLTTQPVPPNDPSVTAKLNEKLLPFSLFDAVLDVPFPGASTASPMELIFPPSDVSSGVVDALSLEDLKKEFGEENGSGGQGGAKVARFAFPDYEDRAYAQELAQRQEYKSRFPGGPELNRYDAYLEETLSPINASGNVNNNYTSANANSPNSNGPKLPSYHTFSHRLANGTTVHCHVRKYLPYHTQAAGRLDVGRRGVRALVLLTRNAGGGNRLYMALLKALEVLTLEAGALSQDVCCKGEEKKEETEDVAMNSSMGIRYRRHFLHAAYKEHMNLCREVAAALASGAKSVLAKPRILTLPLTEVGNGHGLFGAVDTLRLVVPSSFLHEREPTVSGSESIAALSRNDMLPMLRCLGVTGAMRLLSALMSERRIIFTSTNVSKLAAVGYGAVAMMGQGLLPPPPVFVPVLPPGLASLLQTPSPYLIGVLTGPTPHFINLRNVPNIGEVVLFDLDTSGNEPFFAGIPNPQQAVPDLTRRNMDEFDSANRVSLPDILYQDLTEVMKLDKRMFWQGAVQEKLGLAAERGRTAAKNAMKKGLQYFKNKSKEMKAKDSFGTENVEDEEVEEEAAATNSVENALSKSVGKGNYFYEQGFCHEAAELEARVAFTTFFVCILGDLRTYLTQQTPGTSPVVDKEKFMRFRNSSGDTPGTAIFLLCGNLMRGKIFDSFVEARMLEVQLRRAVPEDAPIFALTTNFHRSNKVDFYVNNVKNSVRQVASDADFPGRHLISWNEGVRRRVTELTSAQAFNGDPVKALSLLTEDCRESSVILIDAVMVFWTRILEGKGMQWKKALLALQMFRNLLLNGPINAVSEAIDGFASIRILRSYTEALRGQNSALIREAASELYLLIVDLPVLFARRRQFLNMRRLERDPKPSPLRKETRMVRGINQFRNVHIALRPAGASVAPAPPAVDDLLAREAPNTTASAPPPRGFSEDLLALGDPGALTPPHIAAGGEQSSANPFDMTTLSQAIPSNNYDASQHPTMSNSAPVPSTFPTQQQGTYQSDQKTHPIQLQQPSIPQTQPNQHHTQQPPQGQSSATMSQTSQQIHTQPNQLSMSHQTQPSMPEQSPYISSSMHRIQTDPQAQQTSIPAPQTQTMQQYTGLQNQNPQYSQPPHLINSSSPMNNIVHRPQGQFNTSSAASIPTAPNMNPQSRVPLAYGGVHPLPQMQSPHHHNQFVPGIQPSPYTVQNGGPTYQNTSQRPLGHSTGTNGPPTGPSPAGYQMMQSSQQFQQGGMQLLTNNLYTQQPRASNPNQLGGIQQPGQQQQSMPKLAYSNFDPLAR